MSLSRITFYYLAFLSKPGDWPLSTRSILWTENKVIEELRKCSHGKDIFLRCFFSRGLQTIPRTGPRHFTRGREPVLKAKACEHFAEEKRTEAG